MSYSVDPNVYNIYTIRIEACQVILTSKTNLYSPVVVTSFDVGDLTYYITWEHVNTLPTLHVSIEASRASRPATQQSGRPQTQQSSSATGTGAGGSRPQTQQSQRPGTTQSMAAMTNVAAVGKLKSWILPGFA